MTILHRLVRFLRRKPNGPAPINARWPHVRLDHDGMPVGATFSNIVAVPGTINVNLGTIIDGGPIWPNFDQQTWVRFCRVTKPVDRRPADPEQAPQRLDGTYVWGGALYVHFGHLAAEGLSRVLWSRYRWPDATVLFSVRPDYTKDNLPEYFWTIIDWLGLPRAQVRIIEQPTLVAHLGVMPQAETLRGPRPIKSYLDLLDARVAQHGLVPVPADHLYVTRVGQIAHGKSGCAGEAYLQQVLAQLGVAVMDPATAPFREQMERYAGARTLIFAEGSAVHGRQLLGRIDQTIVVLKRRLGHRTNSENCLRARVRDFRLVNAAASAAQRRKDDGASTNQALSFYDVPALLQGLASIGLDAAGLWDDRAYAVARDADVATWLGFVDPPTPGFSRELTLADARAVFEKAGVGHMIPAMEDAQ